MSPANLTLRFPLELALLAALAIWGAHAGAAGVLSAILAVVAPLAAAVPWGTLVSPKPRVSVGWQARRRRTGTVWHCHCGSGSRRVSEHGGGPCDRRSFPSSVAGG